MNKHIRLALVILGIILITMFGTYRYVMTHQSLEYGDNGAIYSTVFGMTDEYYVEDHTARIMNEVYDAFIDEGLDDEYVITKDGNTISVTK